MTPIDSSTAHQIADLEAANARLRRQLAEQQRLNARLQQAHDQFQAVLEHAPVGISIMEPDGRHVLVNRRWLDLAGRTKAAVLGHTTGAIFPPALAETLGAAAQAVLLSGTPTERIFVVHRHGRDVHLRANLFPLRNEDGVVEALCAFTTEVDRGGDATPRPIDDAEQQAVQLAMARQMIATLHHEINNPLQGVLGFAEYLRDKVAETHELFMPIEKIFRGALRIERLMRKLETLDRVETTTYLGSDTMLDVDRSTSPTRGLELSVRRPNAST